MVSEETIKNCFDVAKKEGNATPCLPINDSLRIVENNANRTVDRSKFYKIQTPQVFQRSVLLKAFEQEFAEEFTDDASVVEKTGEVIQLIKGNEENIKITRPFDLKIAEVFLK